jgi:hypothetical protein
MTVNNGTRLPRPAVVEWIAKHVLRMSINRACAILEQRNGYEKFKYRLRCHGFDFLADDEYLLGPLSREDSI